MKNTPNPIFKVLSTILESAEISAEEKPAALLNLLKPYANLKSESEATKNLIDRALIGFGICSKCRVGKLRGNSDTLCNGCKKQLKQKTTSVINWGTYVPLRTA